MNRRGTRSSELVSVQEAARPDIGAIFADGPAVERALTAAVREAVLRHKHLGESIFVWRDGRVVEIPPEQILVSAD